MNVKALFDAVRGIKGAPLTRADVDAVNAVLNPAPKPATLAPSEECLRLIREFEGLKLEAYLCPAGVPTIGYGATGPDIKLGMKWTIRQAEERLQADVGRFAEGVAKAIGTAETSQFQFDACVSFAFNVGLEAFRKSTLLKRHKEGLCGAAAEQFGKWVFARGKKLPGLVRRRQAEAELYRRECRDE